MENGNEIVHSRNLLVGRVCDLYVDANFDLFKNYNMAINNSICIYYARILSSLAFILHAAADKYLFTIISCERLNKMR